MAPDVVGVGRDPLPTRRTQKIAVLGGVVILLTGISVGVVIQRGAGKPRVTAVAALARAEDGVRTAEALHVITNETLSFTDGSMPLNAHYVIAIDTALDPMHHAGEQITRSHSDGAGSRSDLTQDVRIVGDTSYELLASPGVTPRARPWLSNPTAMTASMNGSLASVDPAQALTPLMGLTGLTDLGAADLGGVHTRHLRGRAPIGSTAAAFGDDFRLLGDIDTGPTGYSDSQTTLDLYVNPQGQLMRVHAAAHITSNHGALAGKVVGDFNATVDYSQPRPPIPVHMPPVAQTETGDAYLQQIETGHP